MKVRKAYNKKGQLMGDVITPSKSELCGISITAKPIVITQLLPHMTTEGCLGANFFERTTTVFDFGNSTLYLKK